jgi:hypothetical protein
MISSILFIFFRGPRTVISISVFGSSSFVSGVKRGSSNADDWDDYFIKRI